MSAKTNLLYAEECYRIMGLVFRVFNEIGSGHKESFYQKAIARSFRDSEIEFEEQLRCKLKYKGEDLGIYILDFLVFNKIILELKQRDYFSQKDIKQLHRYLKVTGLRLGIIIHFTNNGVRYKRILNINN
jgi:GxxExxY protein